jgi:hypothetical protein
MLHTAQYRMLMLTASPGSLHAALLQPLDCHPALPPKADDAPLPSAARHHADSHCVSLILAFMLAPSSI